MAVTEGERAGAGGAPDAGAPEPEPGALRRMPSQRRSRERVERILACAKALIAAQGSDAMRMSELAARAEMSIGALYQYFPDKSAIIRTLAERYNAEGRHCIAEGLADVRSPAALAAAFAGLIDTYYAIFLAEPAIRDIWAGAQADPALRALQLAESRANGALLADAMVRAGAGSVAAAGTEGDAGGNAGRAALAASAFLIMHLGEETMRLAISVDRAEGDALVAAYKRLALRELEGAGGA